MSEILPLRLHNLSYRIGEQCLLDNINLTLEAGQLTVVLGANGAGKTLLLKTCAGLLNPYQGEIQWRTDPASKTRPAYTLVFQQPVLLQRSALANITYALHHLPKAERLIRARQALQWADCKALAENTATRLSSGQQQLIALARAWAMQPQVLFLDEPCANLDPEVSLRLEQLILGLHHNGIKVVMSTHNLAQAQRLASDIVFVDKGRIGEHSPASEFFRAPRSAVAKRFLAHESTNSMATRFEHADADTLNRGLV